MHCLEFRSCLVRKKSRTSGRGSEILKQSLDNYFLRNQMRSREAKERESRISWKSTQAMQSVRSSARMLEEASATGEAILVKYSEQRERLKRAQRKALNVLNTVGLSNTVLKLIERRHRVDDWIKYSGMIVLEVEAMRVLWPPIQTILVGDSHPIS